MNWKLNLNFMHLNIESKLNLTWHCTLCIFMDTKHY